MLACLDAGLFSSGPVAECFRGSQGERYPGERAGGEVGAPAQVFMPANLSSSKTTEESLATGSQLNNVSSLPALPLGPTPEGTVSPAVLSVLRDTRTGML